MNQQEETEITERGEQKLKGGKAGGGQGTEKGNIRACLIQAMADLSLRYLRCLLFNSEPMNQQEETEITEKGEQKLKGGEGGGWTGNGKGQHTRLPDSDNGTSVLRYLRCLLFSSKALAESRLQRIHSSGKVSPMTRNIRWWRLNALRELNLKVDAVISPKR